MSASVSQSVSQSVGQSCVGLGLIGFFRYLEERDEVCGLEERQSGYVIDEFVQGWVGGGGGGGRRRGLGCCCVG